MKPAEAQNAPVSTMTPMQIAEHARAAGRFGIDTEFVSESRYRALLGLVQVVVEVEGGGQHIELLDPIGAGFDHEPLAAIWADPAVEVVIHSGGQDVAILRRAWGSAPANVFDTQVAAGFAGFSAQAGYGNLLQASLGVRLAKSAGFTRWDRRPLTDEQLDYARKDVEDLLPLADDLQRRLRDSGRLEWAREECRRLEDVSDERDADSAYRRLPRVNQLRARPRAIARELAGWRELTAEAEDRPVGAVLPDVALVEIAKRQPDTLQELERIRGIRPDTGRRRGKQIIEAVQRGRDAEPPPAEDVQRNEVDARDAPVISLAESLVRSRALGAGLAYELVAARADLQAIVSAAREGRPEPDVRTLRGWRRDLAGGELLELLAGRRALSVDPRRGIRVTES
ncbi:MAG: ribonuclease [Thermoleophilaceae bacterium]|jgi:ribonuclease D|nr:ribonuclease [Thermoleophilaceae bacterium]